MPDSPARNGSRWKLGIFLLIGAFLLAMTASFLTAARRGSRVVDTDYYSHGLHYGESQAASEALGWTITPEANSGELRVRVSDRFGAPVAGGKLSFEPKLAEAALTVPLALAETSPGSFNAPRPAASGTLQGTLRFTRGPAVVTRKLVLLN